MKENIDTCVQLELPFRRCPISTIVFEFSYIRTQFPVGIIA